MWTRESIFYEDLSRISMVDFIPWNKLRNSTIFVTGATGLIGSSFIKALLNVNDAKRLEMRILAYVRDRKKAEKIFSNMIYTDDNLKFIEGNIEELPPIDYSIDYIVHGASQTNSKEFLFHPVETINTSVKGTMNLLELTKMKCVKGFIYLSSMEVYGYPERGHKVTEDEIGAISPLDLRNSYPLSKHICESLCYAYAKEYFVPATIIRLTQTFGAEINDNDNRVFAYFARCVAEKKNIVLKTKGETERCYLYTVDAVTAILTILLLGKCGEAYNAADEKTYCSIAEMAERVAADGKIQVEYQIEDEAQNGFPQTLYMNLDTTKLKKLGWKPIGGGKTLMEMYQIMIRFLQKG